MREVVNTLLSLKRSGSQWEMLPHDVLPKSTAYNYLARWRDDGTWARILGYCENRLRASGSGTHTKRRVYRQPIRQDDGDGRCRARLRWR